MDLVLSLSTKEVIGVISVVLTFIGYSAYISTILKGKTRPHIFSWIVWGIVNGIVFAGQYVDGGGAGSWVAGVTCFLCFVVAGLSARQGDKYITRTDWIAFVGALSAIPVWYVTKDPLGAVIIATLIDVLGCYPTFRKSWNKPYDENIAMWIIAATRSALSFVALENYTLVTMIFPIGMVFTNGGGACLLLWRRYVQPK